MIALITMENLSRFLAGFQQAQTDEQRFAALIIIAKVAPPGDEAVASQLYDGIGLKFVRRCPHTTPSPMQPSPPSTSTPTLHRGAGCSQPAQFRPDVHRISSGRLL